MLGSFESEPPDAWDGAPLPVRLTNAELDGYARARDRLEGRIPLPFLNDRAASAGG